MAIEQALKVAAQAVNNGTATAAQRELVRRAAQQARFMNPRAQMAQDAEAGKMMDADKY